MRVILNLINEQDVSMIIDEINIIVKNVLRRYTPIYDIRLQPLYSLW